MLVGGWMGVLQGWAAEIEDLWWITSTQTANSTCAYSFGENRKIYLIFSWTPRIKHKWNLNDNAIFIQWNLFDNVVCKVRVILYRPQCNLSFYMLYQCWGNLYEFLSKFYIIPPHWNEIQNNVWVTVNTNFYHILANPDCIHYRHNKCCYLYHCLISP